MKLRKYRRRGLRFLGHYFLANIASILCKSIKIIKINDEHIKKLEQQNKNYILAFWHGTMLIPWYLHSNRNCAALVSRSKDGDLLTKILENWDYKVVRGSSSKGGEDALKIMVDQAKDNYSVAITPDGPRGPAYKIKPGAVVTSKKSKVPLVLAGIGFSKKKKLNSWDRFEVPYLFSKAKIIYSDPVYVDDTLTFDETSAMIQECESKLNKLQEQAAEF
jgi:lysophospholipid acyltransferase (LPLAT)-like uncharacterized protein